MKDIEIELTVENPMLGFHLMETFDELNMKQSKCLQIGFLVISVIVYF